MYHHEEPRWAQHHSFTTLTIKKSKKQKSHSTSINIYCVFIYILYISKNIFLMCVCVRVYRYTHTMFFHWLLNPSLSVAPVCVQGVSGRMSSSLRCVPVSLPSCRLVPATATAKPGRENTWASSLTPTRWTWPSRGLRTAFAFWVNACTHVTWLNRQRMFEAEHASKSIIFTFVS